MIVVKLTRTQATAAIDALTAALAGEWGEGDMESSAASEKDAAAALGKLAIALANAGPPEDER